MISTLAFAVIMASALLHAVWNAIARANKEPGETLAAGVIVSGIISVPGALIVGLPAPASWPWLTAGVVINSIGIRLAMAAYRSAPFALAYPTMRAGIPLLSLPIAMILLNEWPGFQAAAGIAMISMALLLLAWIAKDSGRTELKGVGYALLAAVCGAGYVTSDAMGARLSGDVMAYAFAVGIGNGVVIALMQWLEGHHPVPLVARKARVAFGISCLSMSSFLLYMWSLTMAPIALMAALRETSVFFATAIAAIFMRDHVGPFHWAAALIALAGVITIRLA